MSEKLRLRLKAKINRYFQNVNNLAGFSLGKKETIDPTEKTKLTLDPTKIPSWTIVRYPPFNPDLVIQGKTRDQTSNAFREYQRQEGARLRKALNRITHGRNIFVYNNMRTNQVVYSLTRYLEVSLTMSFAYITIWSMEKE